MAVPAHESKSNCCEIPAASSKLAFHGQYQ